MKITVIGASGNVGSSAAFNIAVNGLADELVLIYTSRREMVDFHAMDIATAVTGRDMLVRAGDYADMQDSDIVVVTAGIARVTRSRLEILPQNLPIIQEISKQVTKFCPGTVVLTASNPVCPLNYAMFRCSELDQHKILGYTYNDSIRFRMRLAQALGVSSRRVEATVIGEHGDSQVLLFSSARVDGKPVPIGEDIKEKLRRQVPENQKWLNEMTVKTGRTAAWTTGVGITAVCRAIVQNTGEMIPCSVVLDGEYGCHSLSMSVPTVLEKEGVRDILEWEIAPDERRLLDKSIEVLKPHMKYVEEFLHLC